MAHLLGCTDPITFDQAGVATCASGWVSVEESSSIVGITEQTDFLEVSVAITGMFLAAVGVRFILRTLLNR